MTMRLRTALFAVFAVFAAAAVPASASAFGPISSFGHSGSGAGGLAAPGNLDIAPDGTFYIPDPPSNRIDAFSSTGEFRFAFGKEVNPGSSGSKDVCTAATTCVPGMPSAAPGGLQGPTDLAVAANGDVYVASPLHNRVDVFSAQGEFRFAFGKNVNPAGGDVCTLASGCQSGFVNGSAGSIAPDAIAIERFTGKVFVADDASDRVSVFNSNGAFAFAFGEGVNPEPQAVLPDICNGTFGCQRGGDDGSGRAIVPADIEVTASDQIAIVDRSNARIDLFSTAGFFQRAIGKNVKLGGGDVCETTSACKPGTRGIGAGEIPESPSLAATPSGNLLVTGDQSSERIDEYSPTTGFIRGFGEGVVDGSEAFQECTAATGCRVGRLDAPGAVAKPSGIAVDSHGAVYAAMGERNIVQCYGDSATPPLCPPPSTEGGGAGGGGGGGAGPGGGGSQPSNAFSFGKLALNRKKGTATLTVNLPGPGALTLAGTGIRSLKATATRAGAIKLAIALTGKARRALLRTGRAKVRASVAFTPVGGTTLSRPRALALRKSRAGRKARSRGRVGGQAQ